MQPKLYLYFLLTRMPNKRQWNLDPFQNLKKVELNILSFRGRAAYGSVPNLGRASGFSKKILEHFLQTQSSYKKFAPSINCFPRLQASSKYIMEVLYHGISFYGQTSETKQLSEMFVGNCWCVFAKTKTGRKTRKRGMCSKRFYFWLQC